MALKVCTAYITFIRVLKYAVSADFAAYGLQYDQRLKSFAIQNVCLAT